MAIVLGEPSSDAVMQVLGTERELLMSAGTVAEALVVAGRRNVADQMSSLIEGLGVTVVPVSAATARDIANAYARWGKGVHPAGLNFGDCFAYALATERACPLVYVGDDFAKADLPPWTDAPLGAHIDAP